MGLGITELSSPTEMEKGMVARMESASQLSLDSMASMSASMTTSSSQSYHASTTSLQSTQSTMTSSSGYSSSMSASSQSLSKSMSQSSASLSSSSQSQSMSQSMTMEKKAIQTSSTVETHHQAAIVEEKAISIEKEAMQTAAAIAYEPIVTKSAVTQVVSKPNVTVKETIHLFAGTLTHTTRSASSRTEEEVLPPMIFKDGWVRVEEDGILAIRQFDFAPSPVKEIKLHTACTVDPPVEFAIPVIKNAIHTTIATFITMEKGELKLIREEIEEDEGMFEEFWEEVRVSHYEEELRRKSEHRRQMMEERIEETRRIQERRQTLMKRIEETKGIYAYSGRRSSNMSMESPYSYRTMDSFGSVTYSPR